MRKHYKKPPVAEARCGFVFDDRTAQDMAVVGLMYSQLRDTHPDRGRIEAIQIAIPPTDQSPRQQMLIQGGAHFSSRDQADDIAVGPRFLAVRRSPPYGGWEGFRPKIEQAFRVFKEYAEPKELISISLSYINRLDIPDPITRIEEYLEIYPFLGKALPQNVSDFTVGVAIPFESQHDLLQIKLGPDTAAKAFSLLLSIDYSTGVPRPPEWPEARDWLELAHSRISDTFEASIKDALRTLFELEEVERNA